VFDLLVSNIIARDPVIVVRVEFCEKVDIGEFVVISHLVDLVVEECFGVFKGMLSTMDCL
jgi:hypothetical protein